MSSIPSISARLTRHSSDSTAFDAPVNSSQHDVSTAGQLVIRFWAVTSWPCDELTGTLTNYPIRPHWTKLAPTGPNRTLSDHSTLNIVLPPANPRTVTHSLTNVHLANTFDNRCTDVNTIVTNLLYSILAARIKAVHRLRRAPT